MKKTIKKFKIQIVTNKIDFENGFRLQFDNLSIYIDNISLNDFINALSESINNNTSVYLDKFSIEKLSSRDIQLLKNNNVDISDCFICHNHAPIYKIEGTGHDKLFLCKKHLTKLVDCLKEMIDYGYIIIKPIKDFEITVLEDE